MTLVDVKTKEEFQVLAKDGVVVAHFYADWAAQCGPMNDVLQELSKQPEYQKVKFAKCPAEDIPEVSLQYKISAVPTIIILQGGVQVERVDGANAGELTKKISSVVSKPAVKTVPAAALAPLTQDELNNRLKSLINAAQVMLFMKGTAQEPRCGFSRQIVGILNELKADYKTFDILNDEQVRQGLKEYSKWPTYPQLYVNGELIGGLDIVKELNASGELASMLPKKLALEDRLKAVINKAPLMVFMKGNRDAPRCGFSRTLISILNDAKVEYETFDILEDEEVRQGLKTFSNWPTYPQVYVKGELIGGLDIIKELQAGGELLATLKPSA